MDFEFQETDIIFADQHEEVTGRRSANEDEHHRYGCRAILVPLCKDLQAPSKPIKKIKRNNQLTKTPHSPPLDIPDGFARSSNADYTLDEGEEEDREGEIVPPHVIVRRRAAAKTASTMCFSYGRTLKGRHLNEVRNSILRMTGFLES